LLPAAAEPGALRLGSPGTRTDPAAGSGRSPSRSSAAARRKDLGTRYLGLETPLLYFWFSSFPVEPVASLELILL